MSTIPSQLPPVTTSTDASVHHRHGRMDRSLADLSSGAQPAATADDASTISGTDATGLLGTIARQNRLAALTDAPAATAANRLAAGSIGSQPTTALAGQANLSPESAWSLLQQD
jgi:hypothetical protein